MTITLKNLASDLASALDGQTVGGVVLTSGTNLFYTWRPPQMQGLTVQVFNDDARRPEPYLSPTAAAMFYARAQILVRSPPGEDGFTQGETLARGLIAFLQQRSVSGYVSITSQNSAPLYATGPDEASQRHVFSCNVEASYST